MSIDYDFVCHKCKKWMHAGQHMGGRFSFGYGSRDTDGKTKVEDFVEKHLFCNDNATGPELRNMDTLDRSFNDYTEETELDKPVDD